MCPRSQSWTGPAGPQGEGRLPPLPLPRLNTPLSCPRHTLSPRAPEDCHRPRAECVLPHPPERSPRPCDRFGRAGCRRGSDGSRRDWAREPSTRPPEMGGEWRRARPASPSSRARAVVLGQQLPAEVEGHGPRAVLGDDALQPGRAQPCPGLSRSRVHLPKTGPDRLVHLASGDSRSGSSCGRCRRMLGRASDDGHGLRIYPGDHRPEPGKRR